MKKLFLIPLLAAGSLCHGQSSNQVKLPQVIPPSPEASAIAKGGQLDVSLFTGAPSAIIPMYEIKLRGITVPIGLNYSSNGTKVDEIPSRTGLGWSLSGGGSLNRIVHGRPDDKAIRLLPPTGAITEQQLGDYYNSISQDNGIYDDEPDEFVVTAPGLSARFIMDNNYNIRFIPHSNLKVTFTGGMNQTDPYDQFIVTNTEGVKYYFGGTGAIETTVSHNLSGKYISHQQVRTSFFLKKIELPEGETITYSYSPVSFATHTGISQGVKRGFVENAAEHCECSSNHCPGPGIDASSFSEKVTEVMYSTVYLTGIQAPNGTNITFSYENRPDGSGDKRLTTINVQGIQYSRKFGLVYADPATAGNSGGSDPSSGNYNKRFFLTNVYAVQPQQGAVPADTIWYNLDYEDFNNLPPRLSFSQDYLGFYNGATNTYFLPPVPGENWSNYGTADRNFRGALAVKGMLKKITYPTGGYNEFVYEPNTVSKYYASGGSSSMTTKTISGSGDNNPSNDINGTWIIVEQNGAPFTPLQSQTANITMQAFANPGCTQCTPPGNEIDMVWLELVNVATNTVTWSNLLRSYTSVDLTCPLTANTTYKLRLKVRGLPNAGYGAITYNQDPPGASGIWVNEEVGGVRVKEVKSFDPVSNSNTSKFYFYARLSDLSKSSGKTLFTPDLMEFTDYRNTCLPDDPNYCQAPHSSAVGEHLSCGFKVLSSNSAMPIYMFDNNHVGYEYVVESDDLNRLNGTIEHTFTIAPINNRTVIKGNEIKTLPSNTVVMTNGNEISTKYYNSAQALLKEVNNTYGTHFNYLNQVSSLAVRRRYSEQQFSNSTTGEYTHPFDVTQYDYQSYWVELQSSQVTEYDPYSNAPLTTTTNYFYGTPNNIQPVRTETINSAGQTTSAEMKYPTDYPSTAPYTTMVTKNVISPVIEQKEMNVTLNKELSKIITNYQGLQSNTIFRQLNIQRSLLGQPLETEATFDLFDSKGNILQITAKDGVPASYIWGYNGLYPVAKIVGKGYNDAIAQSGINLTLLSNIPDDITGQAELDKLRLLTGALVTTYLYRPGIGITMETDPRGRNTYYSYDNIGRLTLIKDHDGNVLKKICYNYAGHAENCTSGGCTNTTPNWQNTTTALRCEQNASGQNTGYQEQEQKDLNTCSATYNQTRWVQAGYNATACPPPVTVTMKSTNYTGVSGFTAVYTNNTTGQVTTFSIPATGGLQTLGTLISGTYTLTISKTGNTFTYIYGSGCNGQTIEGVSATFYNVSVSATSCNSITIDSF